MSAAGANRSQPCFSFTSCKYVFARTHNIGTCTLFDGVMQIVGISSLVLEEVFETNCSVLLSHALVRAVIQNQPCHESL